MVSTTHDGYTITYSEDADNWACKELNLTGKTLKAVKTKIDKVDADARRVSIKVISLSDSYGRNQFEPAEVVMLDEDKRCIWVLQADTKRHGPNAKVQRTKCNLIDMAPDDIATEAAVRLYKEANAALEAAQAKRKEAWDRIPRITRDDLIKANPAIEKILDPEKADV